jgi:hypothetical protein
MVEFEAWQPLRTSENPAASMLSRSVRASTFTAEGSSTRDACGVVVLESHNYTSVHGSTSSRLASNNSCTLTRSFDARYLLSLVALDRGELQRQPYLNRRLSIFNALILSSRVEGDIPSLTAAPDGPETRPLLPASADSIISRSLRGSR